MKSGITEEQADLIIELCSFRHEFHCNMGSIVNDQGNWLREFDSLNERLHDAFGFWVDAPNTDEIDDMQVATEPDYAEETGMPDRDADEDAWQDWYDDTFSHIQDQLSALHDSMEDYLRKIDEKFGTSFCPTGALRIY
jgi:hypothetical protein